MCHLLLAAAATTRMNSFDRGNRKKKKKTICLKALKIILIQQGAVEHKSCSYVSIETKYKKLYLRPLRTRDGPLFRLLFFSLARSLSLFCVYHAKRYNNLITSVWMLFLFAHIFNFFLLACFVSFWTVFIVVSFVMLNTPKNPTNDQRDADGMFLTSADIERMKMFRIFFFLSFFFRLCGKRVGHSMW